jgi:hypothetical protein
MDGSDPSDAAPKHNCSRWKLPLRSTVAIATPSTAHAVAIDHQLCICHGLSDAGTLVVARKLKAGGAEDSRLELESIGIWLAAAIDGCLSHGATDAIADSHLVGSLRRLLDDAVTRESTRGVVSAFVETLAVWLEIEVHGYVAGTPGRFLLSLSPVGADHSTVPAALDDDVVPAGTAMVRLSSSETERFQFTSVPDDVLIRRIAAHGSASWVMVFAGTIDRSDEARLAVLSDLCRDALNTLTVEPIVTPEVEVVEHESLAAAPSSDQGERRSAHRPFHAWIERLASQTIEEGGHASVIVISIPDEDARPDTSRLRSSRSETSCALGFRGLTGGEIGILARHAGRPGGRRLGAAGKAPPMGRQHRQGDSAIDRHGHLLGGFAVRRVVRAGRSRKLRRPRGPRAPARLRGFLGNALTRTFNRAKWQNVLTAQDTFHTRSRTPPRSDRVFYLRRMIHAVDPDRCPVMSAKRREPLMSPHDDRHRPHHRQNPPSRRDSGTARELHTRASPTDSAIAS